MADMVAELRRLTAPPDPNPPPPPMPPFPVKCCIIGKPFAGKTTLAATLCERFELTLIVPEELVKAAVAEAQHVPEEQRPESLDWQVNAMLSKGKAVSDELLAKLVARACKAIAADPARRQGWIVDGFPSTQAQVELFEFELTGYIPKEKRSKNNRKPAILAPGGQAADAHEAEKHDVSGVDLVVVLDMQDKEALQRCASVRMDPATGLETTIDAPNLTPEVLQSQNENKTKQKNKIFEILTLF